MKSAIKKFGLWGLYVVFVVLAIGLHEGEPRFLSDGAYPWGKPIVWMIWLLFLIYSLRINAQENFFTSLKRMYPILWSRQIGLDLYIGLLVPLFLIFLHEGSLLMVLLWLLPVFVFANLATLIYLALNYDGLVAYFV
ncbi:MAG: hypothetical protein HKN50_03285 [Gammaproteobacteria bacterium]|nr:hypothetical protein [Gammaproteobacteria bacterium]